MLFRKMLQLTAAALCATFMMTAHASLKHHDAGVYTANILALRWHVGGVTPSFDQLFLSLYPPHWWEFYHPAADRLWSAMPPASPIWFMFSALMLSFSIVGAWPFSILAVLGHSVIGIGCTLACVSNLWSHGIGWTHTDLLAFHGLWMNLTFAWLHWLNVSRHDGLIKDPPVDKHTGSP